MVSFLSQPIPATHCPRNLLKGGLVVETQSWGSFRGKAWLGTVPDPFLCPFQGKDVFIPRPWQQRSWIKNGGCGGAEAYPRQRVMEGSPWLPQKDWAGLSSLITNQLASGGDQEPPAVALLPCCFATFPKPRNSLGLSSLLCRMGNAIHPRHLCTGMCAR